MCVLAVQATYGKFLLAVQAAELQFFKLSVTIAYNWVMLKLCGDEYNWSLFCIGSFSAIQTTVFALLLAVFKLPQLEI